MKTITRCSLLFSYCPALLLVFRLTVLLSATSAAYCATLGFTNVTILQGSDTGLLPFTLPAMGQPPEALSVVAQSDNSVLVPNTPDALSLAGSAVQRTLRVTPSTNHSGSATIAVSVHDGVTTVRQEFTLCVLPRLENPLLLLTNAHLVAPSTWRFRMLDNGTGSTNYLVEYRSDLSPTNGWSVTTNVTALVGGEFQVAATLAPSQGYFRVKGVRNVVANFANTEVLGEEAGQVSVVVVFDTPYVGTVRYTIGGTAATNDYAGLTGQLQVYGTTAVIPITLTDNASLDQLRCLTLQLEPAPGLQLGAAYRNTITIAENDAAWQGVFFLTNGLAQTTTNVIAGQTNFALPQNANMPFQFTLKIQQSGGAFQGALSGTPGGFFPTNETPTSISFAPNRFTAYGEEIALPAETSLLGSPPRVSLRLIADTSTANQIVSPTLLAGQARLQVRYTPATHLNTTTYGWFQLVRPPPPASTNLVKLVTVP